MVSKFGLLAIAAGAIAFSSTAAIAECGADHSAQLGTGAQVAQAQNPSPTEQMDQSQGSSNSDQQAPASSDEDK